MIIPAGFAQVTIFYGGANLPHGAANTWGIDLPSSPDLDLIAGQMFEAWDNVWPANADAGARMERCLVKAGPNETGATGEHSAIVNGSVVSQGLPPNTAILVQKLTGFGGRKGKGRMYLPAPAGTAAAETGLVDSTIVTDLNDRLSTFLDLLALNGTPMVLLHDEELIPTPVTTLKCSVRYATQRRRQRR